MPTPEKRSINRIIEESVISLFSTVTINSITVPMQVIDDNSVLRSELYCVVECKNLQRLHPTLKDYSATIELSALSDIDYDKNGANCDNLLMELMSIFKSKITASTLSTATGYTVDAILPLIDEVVSGANDDTWNIKVSSAKIYIQNIT